MKIIHYAPVRCILSPENVHFFTSLMGLNVMIINELSHVNPLISSKCRKKVRNEGINLLNLESVNMKLFNT